MHAHTETAVRSPAEQVIHDRLADDIEQTLPDGPSPKSERVKSASRILFALGIAAIGATVVFLFIRGGWPAGLVGLAILFLYAFMGSTPWMAGSLRARDQRTVESIVEQELGPDDSPSRPA